MVSPNDIPIDVEYVLRRIPNQIDYIKLTLSRPVTRLAFRPNNRDTGGISLFRELFTTALDLARSGQCETGYYVIRLQVREITSIGLTLVPDPKDDQLSGHCLIPELECEYKLLDKQSSKQKQQALADITNNNFQTRLVYSPTI
ncbi:MAG: hypothetical protein EPO31_14355 [Gammaproteobacteria bacterium]|nr:MAG: hypothetical protein EPO31_14355 [Gammaproteobacteria bacterium]